MPPPRNLEDSFFGPDLDLGMWFPHYLPHWSSLAQTRARYAVGNGLRLVVTDDQPGWCADLHPEPMRVSAIQSGSRPGQQPFREGLEVRETHPDFWGFTPHFGRVEITMAGWVTPRSMFAFWLSGIEDRPEHSGEICVAEIFGSGVRDGLAEVGLGIHAFRDPALREEFDTVPLPLDVSTPHTYAATWHPGETRFLVDGVEVHRIAQAPDYPMQLMIGVFDFPGRAEPDDTRLPEILVTRVRARADR
jgi:hypothetical protein